MPTRTIVSLSIYIVQSGQYLHDQLNSCSCVILEDQLI